MTTTTSSLYTYDSKHIIWDTLKTEIDSLKQTYPDKMSVIVLKQYPKTMEMLDKYSGVITVARITAPPETLFVGDNLNASLNTDNQWERNRGVLNTDYFEVGIWSLDPDYRDQLYYIVRQILLEKRRDLLKLGFIKFTRTGGGDQEIDLVGQPRIIYRSIHNYLIQMQAMIESTESLVSELDITQTIRVQIDSETNQASETKIVP